LVPASKTAALPTFCRRCVFEPLCEHLKITPCDGHVHVASTSLISKIPSCSSITWTPPYRIHTRGGCSGASPFAGACLLRQVGRTN